MFGSQALETAIGLVLMFFVVALASSQIVEVWSRLFQKRACDLERTIGAILAGTGSNDQSVENALVAFKKTSVYDAAHAGAGRKFSRRFQRVQRQPSYLSAKLFAEAAVELLADDELRGDLETTVPGLVKRLGPITREVGADLTAIKAQIERTFDEAMERAEGAYKRWATALLFFVGLLIAVAGNVSTITVATDLWNDPATRAAVTESASNTVQDDDPGKQLTSVADATDEISSLQIPIGWSEDETWDGFPDPNEMSASWAMLVDTAGWLLTALLVMLGAPFWFDLLTRLVSLRNTGAKPPTAGEDPASATSALKTAAENPPR